MHPVSAYRFHDLRKTFRDDNVRQLTGSIRADWLSLPLNNFRQQLPKRGSGWCLSGQSGSTMGGNQRSPPASLLLPPEWHHNGPVV